MKREQLPKSAETEQHIKDAARVVFLKHGWHSGRVAKIAVLANTPQSLIFYYFRNKEKLYQIVMLEELSSYLQRMIPVVNDPSTTFEIKIEQLTNHYHKLVSTGPHLPLFLLNEMQKPHSSIKIHAKKMRNMASRSVMADQLQVAIKNGRYRPATLSDVIMNILGLTVFPVVAATSIQTIGGLSDESYQLLLEDRQKHIASWVLQMLK